MRSVLVALAASVVSTHADLISYLPLDDATDLTLNGGAAITSGGQGRFGEAISVNGTTGYADVTGGSPLSGGAQRTVAAWVYQDASPTALAIPVALGSNSNSGTKWELGIDNVNGGIEVGVGGGRNVGSGLTGLTENWMLVVSTLPVTGGTVGDAKTYLNGAVTNASGGTRTVNTNGTGLFRVGGGTPSSGAISNPPFEYFHGLVDDVAIWDEALTADEIKGYYDVGASGELSYTASAFDQLKQVHDAGSGSVTLDALEWTYATGLTDPAGLGGAAGSYTLVLDESAGTGLTSSPVGGTSDFVLKIFPNGGSYDFEWNSQTGKVYDLVSSTDLSTSPATWPVWQGQENLPASGTGTNTLSAIPGGGDPVRFFAVVEK